MHWSFPGGSDSSSWDYSLERNVAVEEWLVGSTSLFLAGSGVLDVEVEDLEFRVKSGVGQSASLSRRG